LDHHPAVVGEGSPNLCNLNLTQDIVAVVDHYPRHHAHVYYYFLDLDGILVAIQRQGLELDVFVTFLLFWGGGIEM
jgi:hypothetical protein